jgi:hypothetical protein
MKNDPKKFFEFVDMKKKIVWDTLQVCVLLVSLRRARRIFATFLHVFCRGICGLGLDASKGSEPDGIPPRILKSCFDGFKRPLTLLFNKSLSEGVFPESWKWSYVVPIFKGGKRNLIENYRGIAILSAMPKLFELLVFDSLFFHLKSSIAVVQNGFFKGRSAVSN